MKARSLDQLQTDVDGLDDGDLQRLLTAAVRSYARRSLDRPEGALAPFAGPDEVSATEAIVAAGAILREAEISSFELATILNI
jgi:hypothetical protein